VTVFSGTGTLIRFILRRDRVRIPIWVVAILVSVVGTAASLPDTFPTASARETRAVLMESPAFRLILGPGHGLDNYTYGALMASEMLGIMTVVTALMSIFMVVRHTRAEEESGRAEFVQSSVVGRHASMSAALIVVSGLNILIGLMTAFGLAAVLPELDLAGSLLFGASMAVSGVLLAGVTAVSVQINEFARGANGLATAALGVIYILRGFGDIQENALAWLSPSGWLLQTAPYVDDRWWPLALALSLSGALVVLAFQLSTRRDVASGLVPPRPGPAHASAMLTAPFGLVARLQRGSLLGWTIGVALFGMGIGAAVGEVATMYAENPLAQEYFAILGLDDTAIMESAYSLYILFFALLVSVFTVNAITRLRGEETSLRAENVLATAVSRVRWAGEYLAFAVAGSVLILFVTGLGSGLVHAASTDDPVPTIRVIASAMAYAPTLWLAAGIAIAVYGLVPRLMILAWAVPVYSFFALMFGPLLGLPGWLYDLSPFEYVPRMPVDPFELMPLLGITAIAVVLMIAGLAGFRRRDLDLTG
jgi:ABC-2 type transport system permease protein